MFYKIGFWVLLVIVLGCVGLFVCTNPMKNQGAMSWVDIYSNNPTATLKFLDESLGIKTVKVTKTPDMGDYNIIKSRGALWPFAGVMELPKMGNTTVAPGAMLYFTVNDYVESAKQLVANGAKPIVENMVTGGMMFGVYEIPGGVTIGITKYGIKE